MEYDPSSYATHEDPFPVYRWMRDEAPLYRNERMGFWALSRFADVHAALGDTATYSSAQGVQLESGGPGFELQRQMMLNMDPPDHGEMRRLLSRAFTPRRVADLEPAIRALCGDLLNAMVKEGGGDLVEQFAALVPMQVIGMLLGIEPEDRETVRHLTDRVNHRDPGSIHPPPDADVAGGELYARLADLIRRRKAEPRDDMASVLATTEGLSDLQMVMFCVLLAVGGYETTTKLIANLAVFLERFPDQRHLLLSNPRMIAGAVEEALRFENPSQYLGRTTTTDVSWYGDVVPAGSRFLMVIGAANRDEREFPDPDRYDVTRTITRHLSFGQGAHFCLGAALARLEARVAVEELLDRVPDYRVDLDRIERRHSSNFRGLSRAPIMAA